MTFKSIRNLFLVSLLVMQTGNAQVQVTASGSLAPQEQGRVSPDQKASQPSGNGEGSNTENAPKPDPLVSLLISKGLVTSEEASAILSAGDAGNQRDRLANLLKDKGLISAAEFDWAGL